MKLYTILTGDGYDEIDNNINKKVLIFNNKTYHAAFVLWLEPEMYVYQFKYKVNPTDLLL